MKTKLGILPALFVCACVAPSSQESLPLEPTSSIQSPIESGDTINDPDNPVSSLFPVSTVHLSTQVTLPDGGLGDWDCTGVILTPMQVLTAAHCAANSTTVVSFYGTTRGAGPGPNGVTINASGTIPPAVEPGVVCSAFVPGSYPATCYSPNAGGHFADLEVVTLSSAIKAPYLAVTLGRAGVYAAASHRPSWEVGTGLMNLRKNGWDAAEPVLNSALLMEWVPTTLVASDADGSFLSTQLYGDPGDSGGPVYQYAITASGASPVAPGTYNLILVGILSGMLGPNFSEDGKLTYANRYTSVEEPDNAAWLQSEIALSPPPTPASDLADIDAAAPLSSTTEGAAVGAATSGPASPRAVARTDDGTWAGGGCTASAAGAFDWTPHLACFGVVLLGASGRRRRGGRTSAQA
jgi:hypothetical protein